MPPVQSLLERDWIALDGRLEPIDFDGFADDRSPLELAEMVIAAYSDAGDWVLDPFAGLGTTLLAAQRMGRGAIGFESNAERHAWVTSWLSGPNRIIAAPIQAVDEHDLPQFQLLHTSPPYPTVDLEDDPWGPTYFTDMQSIFTRLSKLVVPGGKVVIEVSNIVTEAGFRPLVGQMAETIGRVFRLEREVVRVNTSDWGAGPGVQHSSLLIFGA